MRRAWSKADGVLAVIGVAIGLPSLAYPFGWDTSVHYYVGREWLLRGAMPYRDVFDHKTPGIHAVHAVLIAMFGEGMWPIRVAELSCVACIGLMAGWLTAARGSPPRSGTRGVAILASNLFYFGFFDHWNTAQSELWCAALPLAAILVVRRARSKAASAVFAGVLVGCAVVAKPVAGLLGIVVLAELARQIQRPAPLSSRTDRTALLETVARFGVGALFAPACVVAYFASHGALGALIDAVVGANLYYLEHERAVHSAGELVDLLLRVVRHFCPVVSVVTAASALGLFAATLRGGARQRVNHWTMFALLAASLATVLVQMKFYGYHWSIGVGAFALASANASNDLTRLAARAARFRAAPAAPFVAASVLVAAFARTGSQFDAWRDNAATTVGWAMGIVSDDAFSRRFDESRGRLRFSEMERVAEWVRAHSAESDAVLIRCGATEIYALSRRHAGSRFFWSSFLSAPTRAYRREEWLAEDRASLAARSPLLVVLCSDAKTGPDSTSWFEPLGYRAREQIAHYRILERIDGVATSSDSPVEPSRRERPERRTTHGELVER